MKEAKLGCTSLFFKKSLSGLGKNSLRARGPQFVDPGDRRSYVTSLLAGKLQKSNNNNNNK